MLVLDRRINQRIVIGGNTIVTILGVKRGRVKVGFAAPDDVGITREELGRPDDRSHKPHEMTDGRLIFTMEVKEGVFIGKDIFLKVLRIERGRVKIGTDAPSDVSIDRGELIAEGTEGRPRPRSKERL